MNGARFVHDPARVREAGTSRLPTRSRSRGLAPLAAKTDRIDAWVLAELARRDLVPAIWLPDPTVRVGTRAALFRLHLVRHRTALKNRIHATLIAFGHPVPGVRPVRERRTGAPSPPGDPRALGHDPQRAACGLRRRAGCPDRTNARAELRATGRGPSRTSSCCDTVPGIAWVLGYTIASEIGDITRFSSPKKLAGYTGLCPIVRASRVAATADEARWPRTSPEFLRWALIEAATHAPRHERFHAKYERTKRRLGKQRGSKIARVELARELATVIWHMLTRQEPFRTAASVTTNLSPLPRQAERRAFEVALEPPV